MRSSPALIAVLLAALAGALVTPAPAAPTKPKALLVGAAEDAAKDGGAIAADAKMSLAALAGFDTIRVTSIWHPGERTIDGGEQATLQAVADSAALHGIRLIVSVYPFGSRTVPQYATTRAQFAAYAASIPRLVPSIRYVIVGNEPNLNRFWMPQFGPGGEDLAAQDYERLLAETYDALKAVSDDVNVLGGAIAPRGSDRPELPRDTHSPTAFIRDLGIAYRQSGRDKPIMDMLAYHPYETNSSVPPGNPHPESTTITLGDYDRLRALLGEAFDDTAQEGSDLPILYTEFGVETRIPPDKESLYEGEEFASVKPVTEDVQADHYVKAINIAACQETVIGIMLFHLFDEIDLRGWQSGIRYVDDTPKASYERVKQAAKDARAGKVDCED